MVLGGEWQGRAGAADIRPCTDAEAWAAYDALKRDDWRESARASRAAARRCPARRWSTAIAAGVLPARYWLAWIDGAPRGFVSSWQGVGGVGQVEDLYVHPDARGRGLASALIRHGVTACREAGAGPVVIVADADDTPRLAYSRMGFRAVAVSRAYLRQLSSSR